MDYDLVGIIILVGSILASITFHEAMHAFVSHWLGDDTASLEGRLTLNPFAHIDLLTTVLLPLILALVHLPPFGAAKPVPISPHRLKWGDFGAALVALAGPLTNLVLAIIGGLLFQVLDVASGSLLYTVLWSFTSVNVAFFVFNMIPYPPLDGSRLLYAIAPDGVRNLMRAIEGMGIAGIFIFMLLFFPFISPVFQHVFNSVLSFVLGKTFI